MKSLLSLFSVKFSVVLLLAGTLSACGFHFRGAYLVPEEISKISVTSYDQFGDLTRAVEEQLRLNDIEMVSPAEDIPNIYLNSGSLSSRTISLYQNSQAAEKELTYSASYTVTIPDVGIKSFTTTVNRSYLSNPQTALAKSVEEEQLEEEMIAQTARQIMRQMARLNNQLDQNELEMEQSDTVETTVEESAD